MPISKHAIFAFTVLALLSAPVHAAEPTLTLEQAYARALQQNPEIRGSLALIGAAEGNRTQQALPPNPEATFEAENFGGQNERDGFEGAEYTMGLQQKIEIGGKRSGRERVASLEKEHVTQQGLSTAQIILAQTKAAYVNIAIAEERLSLADKRISLADKTHSIVKHRVKAAKSADIEHTKADLEVEAAKVAKKAAAKDLELAQIMLANLMGQKTLNQPINADLKALSDLPSEDTVLQNLENTPVSAMKDIALTRQEAALNLAEADSVPDPTIGLGVRRFSEDESSAFLASVSIPLNLFDRNQGKIKEEKARITALEAEKEATDLELNRQALQLLKTLEADHGQIKAYQDELLPSAQKAYSQANEGFDRGAFTFLDLLDAQRTLFDTQSEYLETLTNYHEARARLGLLSGEYAQAANDAFNISSKKDQ